MGLYSKWMDYASEERSKEDQKAFWETYFAAEKEGYIKILNQFEKPYSGVLSELAKKFNMQDTVFIGFIDGINTSLKAGEYNLDEMDENSEVNLEVDLELLYYNMLDAKAEWLYKLPQWDTILTHEKRDKIAKKFRKDSVFVAEKTIGRNDPCSCGSGKKYKKCCGAKASE